ncbi:MAG TPA: sugar phosphate nucleotidyltransferase [Thermoanaerobaculia bacterium]|nr:sugar phosphate nucleotidyltransferase [Thermoanaerobaculia bacterium]
MRALILAAGFGTRMRPLTYTMPKLLVPVCNRPLVGWAVETFLRAGIRDLIVNLHHFPEGIERYLLATYDASFHFSFEAEILGTGGAVKRVQSLLESEEDFLDVNGDTIQFPDYAALQRARREHDALAALLLRHPPAGDRYTPVWVEEGEITGFGTGRGEALMFSGAHCISSRVFRYLKDGFTGIVEDIYKKTPERLGAAVDDNPLWFDTGTPRRLIAANARLLEATLRGDVALAPGSRIDGDSVVAATARGRVVRSTVGERSTIEGDVRDSAVWDDCVVARGVELDRCIVAHGVELKNRGRYRDVLICRDDPAIPRDAPYLVRDGLVVAAI